MISEVIHSQHVGGELDTLTPFTGATYIHKTAIISHKVLHTVSHLYCKHSLGKTNQSEGARITSQQRK